MLLLTREDVRQALTMPEAIDACRTGFIELSRGNVTVPVRGAMTTEKGITLTMPANYDDMTTVKLVTVYGGNPALGLPTIHSLLIAFNGDNGQPLAVMDAGLLTAIRTGAGSGLATDLLARKDASVLGVVGAGVQARTQIEAVCTVRDIKEIRVYSPNSAPHLAEEIKGKYSAIVTATPDRESAVKGADVIVAATTSSTPVVFWDDLAPGTHVNGVGSFIPTMQEVDTALVQNAKVVVDHRESIWEEAGDLIIPRDAGDFAEDDIYAEVGEIAAGSKPGRASDDEVTFFKSVGNAIQDVMAVKTVIANAQANGIGTAFAL